MIWSLWIGVAAAYDVAARDVVFEDTVFDRGTVDGRVYYPTANGGADVDLSGGPYPLVAMMHGYFGSTDYYDEICEALAREGFVVASINTQTGVILNINTFSVDTLALVSWVETASDDPSSWLSGAVDHGDLVAMGHSMGGATLGNLIGLEPRVQTVVAFMPYVGLTPDYASVGDFDGSVLYLAGSADTTAPTSMAEQWFESADNADRALFVELDGAGHQAVTDLGWWDDGILDPQRQLDLVSELATAFVRAEVHGEEDEWAGLIGPWVAPEVGDLRSAGHIPVLWAELDGDTLDVAVAGRPSSDVTLMASAGADMANAEEILTVALQDGIANTEVSVAAWTDNLYVQAVVTADGVETPSRILDLITDRGPATDPTDPTNPTDPTDPTEGEGEGEGDAEAEPDGRSGCATSPGFAVGGFGWLVVGLLRRSRR